MGWEIIDNIRGARGPAGPAGAAGAKGDTGLRGLAGPIGPAGTIASADAESVEASENAAVIMSGSSEVKHAHFKIPRGLPGVNAVENDAAVATYVGATDSDTRAALDAEYARKGSQPTSAADFGLVYDGVTNVTAAISAAIAAAEAGSGVVVIPAGTFTIDGIVLPPGVQVKGSGMGATVLRHSGVGAHLFRAQGAITPNVTSLTLDAARRATTITVSNTAGIVAGDLLLLHDTVSYTTTDASYRSGEMLRVKSVDSGAQITVHGNVQGSWADSSGAYKASNGAAISRLNARKGFSVSDLSIVGIPTNPAIMLVAEYVDGVSISNVGISEAGAGIGLRTCRDVTVSGCSIRDLTDDLGGGIAGYGIYTHGGCHNVVISGNTFSRMRHSFTTLGTIYGMPHNVVIADNSVSETTSGGIDTHAAGDGITISGNVVTSAGGAGISVRSRRTLITSNLVIGAQSHSINAAEENLADIAITNNIAYGPNPGGHGINVRTPTKRLVIQGNTVYDAGADGIAVNVACTNVVIKDNVISGASAVATGRLPIKSAVVGGEDPATSGWVITGNILNAGGYLCSRAIDLSSAGVTGAVVLNNTILGSYSASPVVLAASSRVRENVRGDQPATTVSGAKDGNTALASVIAALVADGLIADTTT